MRDSSVCSFCVDRSAQEVDLVFEVTEASLRVRRKRQGELPTPVCVRHLQTLFAAFEETKHPKTGVFARARLKADLKKRQEQEQ